MQQLQELLHRKMTRKQFLGILGLSLASLVGLDRIIKHVARENPALTSADLPLSATNYGAWRPAVTNNAAPTDKA